METLAPVRFQAFHLWCKDIDGTLSMPAHCTDEILLSSDKTVAVIDGSGVLADPAGINREELVRLAKLRVPVERFDKSKLSKDGYLVRVEEQDVKLPCMSYLWPITRC